MSPKIWFLIRVENGRPEIVSKPFDTYEEAMEMWKQNTQTIICETIYG